MNKLTTEERARILHLLCEGQSIRAVTRLTGASKNTVTKLLIDAGKACQAYHDANVRDVKAKRVQVDEIWSFTYVKQKNVATAKAAPDGAGDTWTWTAIEADTKLIVSYFVGGRDGECAMWFMDDLAARLTNRIQLTSDGHKAYLGAVEGAFGCDVDYAQLVKIYGSTPESAKGRYSPAKCTGASKDKIQGQARPGACFNVLRRAPEPHDADAHAPLYPPDQRLFKEGREPRLHGRAPHDVLQLRPGSLEVAHVSGYGGGSVGPPLGRFGHRCAGRSLRRGERAEEARTLPGKYKS